MAQQTNNDYACHGPLPPSPSSTLSNPPSSPGLEPAGQSVLHAEDPQTESTRNAARAGEAILEVIRRKQPYYNRKSNLKTYFDRKDTSRNACDSSKGKDPARRSSDAHPADKSAATPETPAKKPAKTYAATSPAPNSGTRAPFDGSSVRPKDTPRLDRAGNPRPANKKFLSRDPTGRVVGNARGPDTQLEEVQAWIQEKKHIKFDLIPDVEEHIFDDIDEDVRTEPFHLRNQGRKLVMGKDEETEICAIFPRDNKKIYPCRFLLREGEKGAYSPIKDITQLRDSIDELYYPFEAFTHSTREDAWMQLQAVVGYVFLLCAEADVVYTTSAKHPGSLSTALTHIKETYAPNDAHPTAATVNRNIQAYPDSDHDVSQLEKINEWLEDKNLLGNMLRLVSDPSIYVFQDFVPESTLKVKGIAKVHDRMLFLGENDEVQSWVVPSREPNKAILGWIINIDKETGKQTYASWWPALPTLTFPFQAFKSHEDALSWRKLFYTVGYIFLCFDEAKVAVNMATSFQKHFISASVSNTVEKYYGTLSPPNGWPNVRKPGELDFHGGNPAPVPSTAGQIGASVEPPKKSKQTAFSKFRKTLREIKGRNTKPPVTGSHGAHGVENSRSSKYIAPAGDYRTLDDLSVSLFLEKARNSNGKRPARDDSEEDEENRPTKHKRLEAKRTEAIRLRIFQQREIDKMQVELDEKKRTLQLLEVVELEVASQMGQVMMGMTDDDYDAILQP
ncbi:hypothetical protein PMIN06_008235 [Paraphaeosphaeria minitans]